MDAVILAAGMGKRFGSQDSGLPKCLSTIGGKTLLAHSLEKLAWFGCENVAVITGFGAEHVQNEIARLELAPAIQARYNPNYAQGTAGSILCAAELFETKPLFMLDADLLYDREILRRLGDVACENAIVVERSTEHIASELGVMADGARVKHYAQGLAPNENWVGIYWGMHKFGPALGKMLMAQARRMLAENPQVEYWHVLATLLDQVYLSYIDLDGCICQEIDTPSDLEFARETVYPRLQALGQ